MMIDVIYIPTEELCWIPDVTHSDPLDEDYGPAVQAWELEEDR